MDRLLLLDAIRQLEQLGPGPGTYARVQAVKQFNALLMDAKEQYIGRHDLQALQAFPSDSATESPVLADGVMRLRAALELRPPAGVAAFLQDVRLPEDIAPSVTRDLAELREAATIGLAKTTLLLAGVIAEALLIARHPDRTDRGPGLGALVSQAKSQKLFGRDTLRQLDTLVDYRDLIHPRAEIRNRIEPNEARVEAALSALRLLCAELEDQELRYA